MPEIRFTQEDHAFAQEFVDRLEESGVAGTVREFLSKEDAGWLLFQTERDLRNHALMMRLAEAIQWAAVNAGCAESVNAGRMARYSIHYDNFGVSREDEDYERQYALGKKLPPSPDLDVGGSIVNALMDRATEDMKMRTGLIESQTA